MRLKPALHIRPQSILFTTDFSRASENALRHSIALARHYGATLHMAHIVSSVGFVLAGPGAMAAADQAALRDMEQLELNLVASGALNGVKHDVVVRDGDVWPQIEDLIEEDEVDLLVIGTHGRHGIGRLLLGSIAEKVFRCASCPVVTVGPAFQVESGVGNGRHPQPLLFATDFKAASLNALPYVLDFARERKVKLTMLHVMPLLPLPEDQHWQTADDVMIRREKAENEALCRLKGLLDRYRSRDVETEFVVRFGEPAEEILKVAAALQADAIAMGLHRTTYTQAVTHFRSTIAYEVVSRANCAVLTARD